MVSEVDVDVIIPVSERVGELRDLHRAYSDSLGRGGIKARYIYILDGDFPAVREILEAVAANDDSLEIVQLSRSFGEASAIMAGYSVSRSERLLVLPAYSQVEPEGLPELVAELGEADVAIARRWPRLDSRTKKLRTRLFARLVQLVSGTRFRDLGCGVRALRREVLGETRLYGDQHRFLPILAEMAGYAVVEMDLPQSHLDKKRGLRRPTVPVERLLDLLTVFFLTRFTKRPLRFFGPVGVACAAAGLVALLVLIVQRVGFDVSLADRPALLLSSLLLAAGVQIFAIGLVGELLVFLHGHSLREYRIREIVGPGTQVSSSLETTGERAL